MQSSEALQAATTCSHGIFGSPPTFHEAMLNDDVDERWGMRAEAAFSPGWAQSPWEQETVITLAGKPTGEGIARVLEKATRVKLATVAARPGLQEVRFETIHRRYRAWCMNPIESS